MKINKHINKPLDMKSSAVSHFKSIKQTSASVEAFQEHTFKKQFADFPLCCHFHVLRTNKKTKTKSLTRDRAFLWMVMWHGI